MLWRFYDETLHIHRYFFLDGFTTSKYNAASQMWSWLCESGGVEIWNHNLIVATEFIARFAQNGCAGGENLNLRSPPFSRVT